MVHRPSDPRLLLNLISHEKSYSKHLQSLLDSSHASLTSLSAFAATSAEPVSGVILSIVENFSNADDALCRYKDAVDAWREQLLSLKELETEIASISRDREILVTRVLKASKNEKPPKDKDRTSALSKRTSIAHPARFASESSLSLSIDHSSYSHSSLQTSTKLENAQAELRACETHLTVKEAELEVARVIAIRDGLRIRCDALIDCGRAWVDMGQNGIRISADLQIDRRDTQNLRQSVLAPHPNPLPSTPTPHHTRNGSGSTDASHLVSEISTIGPSQSASQVNAYVDQNPAALDPFIIPNAPNPILGANGSDVQRDGVTTFSSARSIVRPSSTPPTTASSQSIERPLPRNHSMIDVTYVNKPAPGFEFDRSDIRVPAAHAIRDGLVPTIAPSARPKAVQPSSGYLTPVSNDDTDDGRREEDERAKQLVVTSPQHERQVLLPTNQAPEEIPEVVDVGGYAPKIEPEATDVQRTAPVDDSRRPVATLSRNNAPAPVEEPRPPPKHRKYSESSSVKKSGFLSNLKRVFGGTNRQHSEDKAREREVKAWEKEGKRIEKEDRKLDRKEEKMERARLRGVRREDRQREAEGRNEQHERPKKEKVREERRWKPSEREAKMLRADSSSDDQVSVEEQEAKRTPRRVNLLSKGKREQKSTPEEDDFHDATRESQEVERVQGSTGGYIVKQNLDLQKNLRGGIISSGHVAPFDVLTRNAKVPSNGRRRSTITGGTGDQRYLEGRTTGGSFVFERGAKTSQWPSPSHPGFTATSGSRPGISSANVTAATEPFPASATRPSGIHSTLRNDTKFWENLSNRSGSPVQVPPTINERGESSATITAGQGGVDRGPQKQRQIAISQPHSSNAARGHGRDVTAPAAMSTPKRQMMNGNTRRAVSVDHGRSNSVGSLPSQVRTLAPVTGQYAGPSTAEPGESLMSIVDGLARSNRRAWNMGLMEMSRSRENMRLGTGHETRPVDAGSGRMAKGKATDVGVINDSRGHNLGRINTTGYDNTPRKEEIVSAKTMSSLPVESLNGGSPRPTTVIKGIGGDQDDLQEGDDDSASTSSYETGQENLQDADDEMPNLSVNPLPVPQKPEEIDRRTISPPPAIRFKAPDRANSASPASRGESAEGLTPRRRKSVRVSLKPTFSPTPPAIEDEADQYMRAPFVFKEQIVAPPSVLGGNQSRVQIPSQPANANGTLSKDLWDDDSEANAEYEEAKKLFLTAARRDRDVMW